MFFYNMTQWLAEIMSVFACLMMLGIAVIGCLKTDFKKPFLVIAFAQFFGFVSYGLHFLIQLNLKVGYTIIRKACDSIKHPDYEFRPRTYWQSIAQHLTLACVTSRYAADSYTVYSNHRSL
ncbi:MAG: hypothetical protein AAF558_07360 [Verrucomicrobiota bacterium]